MQRQTNLASLIILLLMTVQLSAVFNIWTANQKYAFAGKATVNMQTQIANNGIDWQLPINITVNYPRALSSLLPYQQLAVIADYDTDYIKSDGIYLFIEASNFSTETYMDISIKTSNASRINKISISYMAFSFLNEVNDNYGIYQLFQSFNNTSKQLTNDPSSTHSVFIFIDPFYLQGATETAMMIGGLDVDTDGTTSTIDLDFSVQILSSTKIYLTISSNSTFTTYLAKYLVQIIIYNPNANYVQVINYRFFHGTITGTNKSYSYVKNFDNQISSVNTICGLTSFSISFKESMSFSILFTSGNLIQIEAGYGFNFVFTFVSIYSRYCDYRAPYHQSYKDECYTDCLQQCYNDCSNLIADYDNLKCLCMNQDGFQVDNSQCFSTPAQNQTKNDTPAQNQTKNLSTTTTGSYIEQQNQLAIILGVLLGCTILLFVTGVLIYCFCCKKGESTGDNEIKYQINFEDKLDNSQKIIVDSNNRLQEQINIQSPKKVNPIQEPHYNSNPISKLQQTAKDKQTTPSTSWQKCNKYDSNLICSNCTRKRCYLEISCGHFFHITCIMEVTKLNPGCPKCHKGITLLAKLYCSGCGQKRMDTNLMIAKDITKKEMECDQCQKIPK